MKMRTLVLTLLVLAFVPAAMAGTMSLYGLDAAIDGRIGALDGTTDSAEKREMKKLIKAGDRLTTYLDFLDPRDKKAQNSLAKVVADIEKSRTTVATIRTEGVAAILAEFESTAGELGLEVDGLLADLDAKGQVKLGKKKTAAQLAWQKYLDAKAGVVGKTGVMTAAKVAKLAVKALGKYAKAVKTGTKLASKPPSGKKSFVATVTGMGSFSGNSKFSWWSYWGGDLTIAGHDGNNLTKGKVVNLEVKYDPAKDGPKVFTSATIYYGEFADGTKYDFMNPHLWRGTGRVEITSNTGGELSGTFSGTLTRINGEGPSSVTVTGTFSRIGEDPLD